MSETRRNAELAKLALEYGTLTNHTDGKAIRPATRDEWVLSICVGGRPYDHYVNDGDQDLRMVVVTGGLGSAPNRPGMSQADYEHTKADIEATYRAETNAAQRARDAAEDAAQTDEQEAEAVRQYLEAYRAARLKADKAFAALGMVPTPADLNGPAVLWADCPPGINPASAPIAEVRG